MCVLQEVAASFHAAMRPEEYLAQNEQLWDAMHDMLAPQAPAPLRRLPYPFRASMLALLSTELPHLVAPAIADGGGAAGTSSGVRKSAIALYSVGWVGLAAPATAPPPNTRPSGNTRAATAANAPAAAAAAATDAANAAAAQTATAPSVQAPPHSVHTL